MGRRGLRASWRSRQVVAVIDAKHKRLKNVRPERRFGVESSDPYQLAAYLSRLDPDGVAAGMLLYPFDREDEESTAEGKGAWKMEAGSRVQFRRVPVCAEQAIDALREMLAEAKSRKARVTAG